MKVKKGAHVLVCGVVVVGGYVITQSGLGIGNMTVVDVPM